MNSNSTIRTVKNADLSNLGYALLGLLLAKPSSGYDLRKIFSTTAMMSYSDSPGAIYPALRRLQQQGLIRGSIESGAGLRRRQVFRLTPRGSAELRAWVMRPVTHAEVIRGMDAVMLRYAFSEQAAGRQASIDLLKSLQSELLPYLPTLHQQRSTGLATMPIAGRLALEYGIRSYEVLLRWTRDALAAYAWEPQKKGGKRS